MRPVSGSPGSPEGHGPPADGQLHEQAPVPLVAGSRTGTFAPVHESVSHSDRTPATPKSGGAWLQSLPSCEARHRMVEVISKLRPLVCARYKKVRWHRRRRRALFSRTPEGGKIWVTGPVSVSCHGRGETTAGSAGEPRKFPCHHPVHLAPKWHDQVRDAVEPFPAP